MASPYLHEAEEMQIPVQLTLRNGPEVLNTYTWTLLDQGVTHGRQKAHAGGNHALIVLHQANDGLHWIIDHMTDVPEADQQELVDLQQKTRNTALVFTAHPLLHGFPWSLPPFINNMHAFKALQRQPFHRAKRKLHPALTAVITRLHQRDGSQDGNHFPMSQSPAQLWDHGHTLTEYQVWVCYRVATHQLNLYFPGRDMDSTCKRHLACIGQHEGLLHILWDCVGASKSWAYIITQWTRSEVSSAQMELYKQAALSRAAPELPPRVRADIEHMFPDKTDIVGRAWKRIWWIACSVCVTMLWIQRNKGIHKQESASTEQEVAEVKQVLLRQLRAVAIREQRRDKDVSKGVYLRLATEMFQDTINIRQPVLHSPRNRQETTPGVLEWLRTFQKSCKP